MKIIQPDNWPKPKGYSNALMGPGKLLFISGQVGWDENEQFQSDCLVEQTQQALTNTLTLLRLANADVSHIARMTWYITDKQQYLDMRSDIGAVYRKIMGRHFPTMSMLEVSALMEDQAKVEIESTALIPD